MLAALTVPRVLRRGGAGDAWGVSEGQKEVAYRPKHLRNASIGPGAVTLGEAAARLTMLEVACNRCQRHGQLSAGRLVAEHGAALPISELRRILAADCPRMIAGHVDDVCGAHFPQLSGLMAPPGRS